jgi:hypothetical protein
VGADYPKDSRGLSAVQKKRPVEKQRFCLNSPQNVCEGREWTASRGLFAKHAQTVRERIEQKSANSQEHLPKVVLGSPKRLKLLSQDLGEMICVTR